MKVEMTGQIFITFFSIKFRKYLFSGFRVIKFLQTDRRTDGRSDFNKRFAGMRKPLILVAIACSEVRTCASRIHHHHHHHHHKHQGMDPLIPSVCKVTTALSNVSSFFQLFSFLVVCSSQYYQDHYFLPRQIRHC